MAPRKTASRKKRTTRGRKSGQSNHALIAVGAIIAVGAVALWATSQNKSPSASVSGLWRSAMNNNAATPPRSSAPQRQAGNSTASQGTPAQSSQSQGTQAQIKRPPLNVGQPQPIIAQQPQSRQTAPQQMAALAPKPDNRPLPNTPAANTAVARPPHMPTSAMPPLPPVAPQQADDNSHHASGAFKIPKAIIARQALVIRDKAWKEAKIVGSVEKGREMRTYAKVGRWHRVVVPSTNIIGWVEEDQLAYKSPQKNSNPLQSLLHKSQPQAQQQVQQRALTTGSIRQDAPQPMQQKASAAPSTRLVAPVYPQQNVGKN